jgi:hypothetical protein
MPGRQCKHELGNELGEPDQPEVEGAAADGVDLPADGDVDDLAAESVGEYRGEEVAVVAGAERGR